MLCFKIGDKLDVVGFQIGNWMVFRYETEY